MILPTAYCPPAEYFALLARNPRVLLEACESYRKQSWRNRCRILTANGPMDLRVPVLHDGERLVSRVRIDRSTDWVRRTKYAIDTAYYASPFFEYYRDEFFGLLDGGQERLWDLNMDLIRFFCSKIGIAPELVPTQDWVPQMPEDMREALDPKRESPSTIRPYWQVFREKYGFVGGLSVMDLLFNEGPESLGYLL